MSENIYDDNGLDINSFYGGNDRGKCLQFMIDGKYVQLTEQEVRKVVKEINSWLTVEL